MKNNKKFINFSSNAFTRLRRKPLALARGMKANGHPQKLIGSEVRGLWRVSPEATKKLWPLGQRGFTVIETLAVVGIIALLSSVTVIALESYQPTLDLNGAAREIVTDLRYVQQLAVSEQIRYGIQFFKEENKYQMIKYDTSEEIIKEKTLPQGIAFHSITGLSGERVKFNPYGSVEEEGEIIIINADTHTKTIQIKPSGFIKIQ